MCEALPDTNCSTRIQFGDQSGGPVAALAEPLAIVQILEATRGSPDKKLQVLVRFQAEPMSQNGTIQVSVDTKPFADVPFVRCLGLYCIGETQIGAVDVATLEGAKSFEIQAQSVKVSSPIRDFAAARASTGRTLAEVKAEGERLQQDLQKRLQKRAAEINEAAKKADEARFLADAPAGRPQEGFCAALKRVMAAVPDDFKSIIGEYSGLNFSTRVNVPGNGKCEIDSNKVSSSYTCSASFRLREVADKQLASLAQLVGKCLPDQKAERRAGNDGFPRISFDNRKTKIDVYMYIGKTAGGGGYDVVLWVDRGL
jgi:hypothetical protein